MSALRGAIAPHLQLSIRRQCRILGVNRSMLSYEPVGETELNLALMARIDELYTKWPFWGSRKMACISTKKVTRSIARGSNAS
jgi:putative transposase